MPITIIIIQWWRKAIEQGINGVLKNNKQVENQLHRTRKDNSEHNPKYIPQPIVGCISHIRVVVDPFHIWSSNSF